MSLGIQVNVFSANVNNQYVPLHRERRLYERNASPKGLKWMWVQGLLSQVNGKMKWREQISDKPTIS
jgi:hypothetical protein